jgi:hypothetical protein
MDNHECTDAIKSVVDEMNKQDEKWGADRNLHSLYWNAILMEEVGEASKEVIESTDIFEPTSEEIERLRGELVQVAAVAIQWIECLDRTGE